MITQMTIIFIQNLKFSLSNICKKQSFNLENSIEDSQNYSWYGQNFSETSYSLKIMFRNLTVYNTELLLNVVLIMSPVVYFYSSDKIN